MKPTLSSILGQHLEPFLSDHKIPLYQLKALKSYRACRTPLMGSHSRYCENGHLMGVWYSSCKRRGCAQCQGLSNARWLAAQKEQVLSVTHHHWVFTLPHDLLNLWRFNRTIFQDLLFRAVADVLTTLSRDSKYLGAQPGFVLTLHTWGRNLSLHPHIHCLITHGGMRDDDWVEPKKSVMFPARVMMQLFRGKLLAALRDHTSLVLPPDQSRERFCSLLNKLGRVQWVVHCCKPYQHGRGVLAYLSRYVKSGALKNNQFCHVDGRKIVFNYQSHRTLKQERLVLDPNQFIVRLCDHVPQRGKNTTRYYGLYHGSCRRKLDSAREHHHQAPVRKVIPITWAEYLEGLDQLPICPTCGGRLRELINR